MSKKNDRRQVSVEGTQPKHGGKHPSVAKQPSANGHLSTEKRQQTKNEKKERTLARGAAIGIAAVVTLGIVALSAYYLIARNSDVLWMAQGKNFFTTNGVFLAECMRQPGGLIAWVASWLTQFFYYPALGASIMIALWIVSLWLTKWAFRVRMEWLAVLAKADGLLVLWHRGLSGHHAAGAVPQLFQKAHGPNHHDVVGCHHLSVLGMVHAVGVGIHCSHCYRTSFQT